MTPGPDSIRLSIIVPLYNSDGTIERCLLSALGQNIPHCDYEIIVADDGSTDLSLLKADNLARQFPNIRVLSKQHEGVGKTRNFATDAARGKYLLHLDADDYLEGNVLAGLLDEVERSPVDLLAFDIRTIDEAGRHRPSYLEQMPATNGTATLKGTDYLREGNFITNVFAWLFRREFLAEHNLRFAPVWHENEEFTPRALYFAGSVRYTPLTVYNYVMRSDPDRPYSDTDVFDLAKGMERLTLFARTISREDPHGGEILLSRISKVMFRAIGHSATHSPETARRLTAYCRQAGIIPLLNDRRSFKIWLLNNCPALFRLYYIMRGK